MFLGVVLLFVLLHTGLVIISTTVSFHQKTHTLLPSASGELISSQVSLDIMNSGKYTFSDGERQGHLHDMNNTLENLAHNTTVCPNRLRPKPNDIRTRNTYWQMHMNGTQEIHLYSAFYDDRPAVGIVPVIRIQAIATPTTTPLYCHIWYDGHDHPLVVEVSVTSTGRGDTINKIRYDQSLFTCTLDSSLPVPTHVSVAMSHCGYSSIYLPIYIPVRSKWKHEFGVCVVIAFGTIPTHSFVEWMEVTSMFGVTEINVYNGSMSTAMTPVFEYYEHTGVLRVHQMPPPTSDFGSRGTKLSSPASLNDCMLRNMYRYKYIIVIDFDEIIVPREHTNYHDMLAHIDKVERLSEPWLSYTFRNVYYFLDIGPTATQPEYSTVLRYQKRQSQPSAYLYAPKSFIDPRRCLSVFNHYCWKRFKNSYTPEKWTIDVKPEIAMSHHYRRCGFGKKCIAMFNTTVVDAHMLTFNRTLVSRMEKVFSDIHYNKPLV